MTAERNRLLIPNAALVIDAFRAQFPDCRVTYAKDLVTGHSVGTPSELLPPVELAETPEPPKKGKKK